MNICEDERDEREIYSQVGIFKISLQFFGVETLSKFACYNRVINRNYIID